MATDVSSGWRSYVRDGSKSDISDLNKTLSYTLLASPYVEQCRRHLGNWGETGPPAKFRPVTANIGTIRARGGAGEAVAAAAQPFGSAYIGHE